MAGFIVRQDDTGGVVQAAGLPPTYAIGLIGSCSSILTHTVPGSVLAWSAQKMLTVVARCAL